MNIYSVKNVLPIWLKEVNALKGNFCHGNKKVMTIRRSTVFAKFKHSLVYLGACYPKKNSNSSSLINICPQHTPLLQL